MTLPRPLTSLSARRGLLRWAWALPWWCSPWAAAQHPASGGAGTPVLREHFWLDAKGRLWRHDTGLSTAPPVQLGEGPWRLRVLSGDGLYLLLVHEQLPVLQILSREGRVLQTHALRSRDGLLTARVSAVVDATARRSFLVALQDLPEIWEISYNPRAEEIYEGLVHDFRMGEGVPMRGFLGVRRIRLPEPLAEVIADPIGMHALGVSAGAQGAARQAEALRVINLDVRRELASLAVPVTLPLPGHAVFDEQGRLLLVQSLPAGTRLLRVDLEARRWTPVAQWPWVSEAWHGHTGALNLWVSVQDARGRPDHVQALDRRTLQPVGRPIRPGEGVSVLEMGRDGTQVLLLSRGAGDADRVEVLSEASGEVLGSFTLAR
ncbi:MAG: hypothetical protein JNJ71_00855 [Rubrivivax sp.]|nr:hypothetical protein [Rubrivivax sp.]